MDTHFQFNPQALTLAREERGLTQTRLAELMETNQGTISKVENGQMVPDRPFVEAAANALRYPIEFFSNSYPLRELPPTTFRKQKQLSPVVLRSIRARVALRRRELEVLMRSVDIPEKRIPLVNLQEENVEPEDVAKHLRAHLRIPRGPIENLTKMLEDAGVAVIRFDFGSTKISGMSVYDPRDGMPPMMLVNPSMPPDRNRFTMAHETGHLCFHHHLPWPPPECEAEADRFASELLMPADDIYSDLRGLTLEKLAQLKLYWKVSMRALIMRADQLGAIPPNRKRTLLMQMSKMGVAEPVQIREEYPSLVREVATFHIQSLGYNENQLSSTLCLHPDEMRQLYLDLRPHLRVVSS
ncbi:ImmA/IrrE family metallo-endopeptidase [Cystobacter fuscus]|uniref:helix-turn-helix domain-containing protein n=1 Tax=Cystobacter fuscus TaxID=43 RepID=UPI002B2B4E07|nr:ImmA/IrrE family metallo-endopeptidase [Cystobacter fuscus]